MAIHTDLSIYKAAYDLLSLATDLTRNIPRDIKAGLGAAVRNECIAILQLIAKTNSVFGKNRLPYFDEIQERVHTVEFLMRVLRDKGFIGTNQHAAAIQVTVSIGKQANGWKRKSATSPVA